MTTPTLQDALEVRPFAPRPIVAHDVLAHGDWRLKRYAIALGDAPVDWDAFDDGVAMALATLPQPARAPGRPGAGFVIAHRGRGADYVVLGWWSEENELPVHVVRRDQAPHAAWRAAREGESFCVWDLQVIALERDHLQVPHAERLPLARRAPCRVGRLVAPHDVHCLLYTSDAADEL